MRQSLIVPFLFTLGVLPLLSQTSLSGDHVVPAPDLRQAVRAAYPKTSVMCRLHPVKVPELRLAGQAQQF